MLLRNAAGITPITMCCSALIRMLLPTTPDRRRTPSARGIAQDRERRTTNHVFFSSELAADRRRHAEHAEVTGADALRLDAVVRVCATRLTGDVNRDKIAASTLFACS